MEAIPIEQFAKDHWSMFAYLETRCVDHGGEIDAERIRVNGSRHPGMVGDRLGGSGHAWRPDYGTKKKDGTRVDDHDDVDCLDDLEEAGLIIDMISGMGQGCVILTDLGKRIAAELRKHKMEGGNFSGFAPQGLSLEESNA